jgi:DNA modification methylase
MEILYWKIDAIVPYERNARKIPRKAIDKVAASIREFGWRQPIVVDKEGVIICGHARWLAAKKLGLEQVPVHPATNLTPAQVKAYRLMDNRSHEETEWNFDLLGEELLDLRAWDLDLKLTGFDPHEIDTLLLHGADDDERADQVPELPEHPVTKPGDLWLCGSHRVLCADATSPEAVRQLLGNAKPLLMETDPPYGVEFEPGWRERAGLGKQRQTDAVPNDHQADWTAAYRLFPGDVAYVWHAGVHAVEVARGLLAAGFVIRSQIIWGKQHFVISRGNYHWQHEPCWYAVRKGRKGNWCGDRKQSTLWQVPNLSPFGGDRKESATGHGTQKPVALMLRPILNHTHRGEAVYDPFLGSGTTLIAAEKSGRICYGMDIDCRFVDIIVQRWERFTRQAAKLAATQQSFQLVRKLRGRSARTDRRAA